MKIEYKVREITRYIVTRYEHSETSAGGSDFCGQFDSKDQAWIIADALAGRDRLVYASGDEHVDVICPERPLVFAGE